MNKICTLLLSSLLTIFSHAETVKNISVSGKEAFTDHLSLKNDSKDMDLMVKFFFDETNEALSVTLISYRDLFVFYDDVSYKQSVGCHRKLKTDKLPYVVTMDEGQQFRLSKALKRSIAKPRKKHIFHRWINYDGLIPQPTEFQMVNDYVEQKFDIKNKQNNVTVTLHDIFLMEKDAKKTNRFWIVFGKDLDTKYQITLLRDPCLGKEEDIKNAQQTLSDVKRAFRPFNNKYHNIVNTEEEYNAFLETKSALLRQFPHRTVETNCENLQQLWTQYNVYVDSIAYKKCKYVEPEDIPLQEQGAPRGGNFNANYIMSLARQIDVCVAKYQLSTDQAEQNDLINQCRELIAVGKETLRNKAATTEEQKQAVRMFLKAETYFKKTSLNKH